ncbi:sestrin-3-like isoform 3-T3 [Amazona ochrocephala]
MIVCPQSVEHPRGSRCQRLPGQVVKMSGSDPERPQLLFVKVLASWGRLEAVTQQMGCHPQYLDSFLKMQHYLMHMDGPLPFDCRHYIAIMAAARHQCRYLVNLHVLQFLRAGGDPQWLRGLNFIPPKLRNLNEINKILAHRPWLITKEHIEVLAEGLSDRVRDGSIRRGGADSLPASHGWSVRVLQKLLKISEWSWSLAELVHAVVLLAHCHALASFVFGCGCEQDEGPGGRGVLKPLSPGNQCFCEATTGNSCSQELLRINRKRSLDSCMELDSLRERMQRIHVEAEGREETRLLQQDQEEGERHEWRWVCRMGAQRGGAGGPSIGLPHLRLSPLADAGGAVTSAANLACYMQDPDFGYQDFARRDEDQTQVFRVQDYSWEDHGFSLVNRLYSDIGHLLDEKFRTVDGLQSSTMAKRQGCEPSVFKRGIWNYIHCMFGIRYDDYDYAEVNQLLERVLKVYIKTVTCYPEKTNSEMFDRFWKQFKHSEKVHVNLLILEARMQAELLYALQAITQYMVS